MWTDSEEARSDFVLAAATAVFGPLLLQFVLRSAPFLVRGLVGALLLPAFYFAMTGLVPLLLARYRGNGAAAFGLDGPRSGIGWGIVCSLPIVAAAVLDIAGSGAPARVYAGMFALSVGESLTSTVYSVLTPLSLWVGLVLLYPFLTVKARDGFAYNEVSRLEALRTFGSGAAALALLVGLLISATGRVAVLTAFIEAVALLAVILLVDRVVEPGTTTSRATILAPSLVALLIGLQLFGGNFLLTLRLGLLAGGFVLATAVLIETRRHAWAVVPMMAVVTLYYGITPFTPVQFPVR